MHSFNLLTSTLYSRLENICTYTQPQLRVFLLGSEIQTACYLHSYLNIMIDVTDSLIA